MDKLPTPQQRKAIEHQPAPLMILAGAGTGKTFTLIERIVYLIEKKKVNSSHLLVITYTERAAAELRSRTRQLIGSAAQKMTIGTFHAVCYQLVKEFSGITPQPRLLDESEAVYLLLEDFDSLGPFYSTEFALNPEKAVVNSFLPFFNRCRDELIVPSDSPDPDQKTTELEIMDQIEDLRRVYELYQRMKSEINVVDYGDMILKAHQILAEDQVALAAAQEQFRHIVVDEFQDNNYALNEIIRLLASEQQSVTVVGDDDQVIYSFRGASAYNIKAFKDTYGDHHKFLSTPLEINFRSHQEILDIANNIIQHNEDRQVKWLKAEGDRRGPLPRLIWAENREHAGIISHEIKDLTEEGHDYSQMAVLCRTRNQAKSVASVLSGDGIPVISQFQRFFEIPVIKTLVAWCQVAGGGNLQEVALYRLIREETDQETAFDLFSRFDPRDRSPRRQLINSINGKLPAEAEKILQKIDTLERLAVKKSAGEMVWEICKQAKLMLPLVKRHEYDDQVALLNVSSLMRRAQDFSSGRPNERGLRGFNLYLETMLTDGNWAAEQPVANSSVNAVTVQTIHGAKGAEFPVVFVPFNRSQSFPLSYQTEPFIRRPPDAWLHYVDHTGLTAKDHHLQEERRLLYVAITRAQERLYLLAPEKATSPFIKSLDKSIVKEIQMQKETAEEQSHVSPLRRKYQERLQRAVARDDFVNAGNLVKALGIIHRTDSGETIEWSDEPWQHELKKELLEEFTPQAKERISLSASAIETYLQCSLKYRLKQMDRIPESGSRPQLTFGSIVHRVLERFHAPGKPLSEERMLQLLDEEWREGEFQYEEREEKLKEQAVEMLVRYVNDIGDATPDVVARELKFIFDLDDVRIQGMIDRIDRTAGSVRVVDYKTSKTVTPAKKSTQLAIYSLYLEECEEDELLGPPGSSTLYYLRDEEQPARDHSFTPEELSATRETIAAVAQGVRSSNFTPTTGHHCNWCDYKDLTCPAWEE